MSRLMRVKKLENITRTLDNSADGGLQRTLGLKDLVAIGIGAVVGSGIFVTVGVAAAGEGGSLGAGPAVCLSFVLVALAAFFCTLCYAEFASMIPASGSAYTYAYATMGELVAWVMAWDICLEYTIGNVAVAIAWGSYFTSLFGSFGLHLPTWLTTTYAMATPEVLATAPQLFGIPISINVPAMFINVILTVILVKGVRESASFTNFLVILKLLLIFFVVGLAGFYVDPANWSPFLPNGFQGVAAGATLVFFSYVGFDTVACMAEETKNPERNLPLGMIITLAVSTVVYVAVALVLTGVVPYEKLGCADPMAFIFSFLNMPWAAVLVCLIALVAMTAVLLVFQLGQTRIFITMARDGLLPKVFERLHPKFKTPHLSTIIVGAVITIGAGFLDISWVLQLCNVGTLFTMIVVALGIMILRRTRPEVKRPFRTPCVPLIPLLCIAMCGWLVYIMGWTIWVSFLIWQFVGIVFYFFYGYTHSVQE